MRRTLVRPSARGTAVCAAGFIARHAAENIGSQLVRDAAVAVRVMEVGVVDARVRGRQGGSADAA